MIWNCIGDIDGTSFAAAFIAITIGTIEATDSQLAVKVIDKSVATHFTKGTTVDTLLRTDVISQEWEFFRAGGNAASSETMDLVNMPR